MGCNSRTTELGWNENICTHADDALRSPCFMYLFNAEFLRVLAFTLASEALHKK